MNHDCVCSLCSHPESCSFGDYLSDEEVKVLSAAARISRGLVLDMVARARSGHLGMALDAAEIGAVLFGKYLRCCPLGAGPRWLDRDRFMLSAGHASAFLYAWLHLAGYPISLDDLKAFRQGNSKTTGHPEFAYSLGIECSSGPLGQGVANAVGEALAQKKAQKSWGELLQGRVICLAGDGCLQEGVAMEAVTLAGHWHLDNLILIYDANGSTLDGPIEDSQSQDVVDQFLSLGWGVQTVDGSNLRQFAAAFVGARAARGKPQLILAKTIIGKGFVGQEGTHQMHGCDGLLDRIAAVKENLGLEGSFIVPGEIRAYFSRLQQERRVDYENWFFKFEDFLAREEKAFLPGLTGRTFDGKQLLEGIAPLDETLSVREAMHETLNFWASRDESLLVGSADLFASIRNDIVDGGDFSSENWQGRNIHFGVREHAMGAIANGLAYDGAFRVVVSTFLSFSNYLFPAVRMAALAGLPVGFLFSHDSLAVGPDGPTHQPVEALPALRLVPRLNVFRPADGEETVAAVAQLIDSTDEPVAFVLPRQKLPSLPGDPLFRRRGACRGGYILVREKARCDIILLATGSEVSLACQAAEKLGCRVVSMPCRELFEKQSEVYRMEVLSPGVPVLVLEAAAAADWWRFGDDVLSVEDFGRSMDGDELMKSRGFSIECVLDRARKLLGRRKVCES